MRKKMQKFITVITIFILALVVTCNVPSVSADAANPADGEVYSAWGVDFMTVRSENTLKDNINAGTYSYFGLWDDITLTQDIAIQGWKSIGLSASGSGKGINLGGKGLYLYGNADLSYGTIQNGKLAIMNTVNSPTFNYSALNYLDLQLVNSTMTYSTGSALGGTTIIKVDSSSTFTYSEINTTWLSKTTVPADFPFSDSEYKEKVVIIADVGATVTCTGETDQLTAVNYDGKTYYIEKDGQETDKPQHVKGDDGYVYNDDWGNAFMGIRNADTFVNNVSSQSFFAFWADVELSDNLTLDKYMVLQLNHGDSWKNIKLGSKELTITANPAIQYGVLAEGKVTIKDTVNTPNFDGLYLHYIDLKVVNSTLDMSSVTGLGGTGSIYVDKDSTLKYSDKIVIKDLEFSVVPDNLNIYGNSESKARIVIIAEQGANISGTESLTKVTDGNLDYYIQLVSPEGITCETNDLTFDRYIKASETVTAQPTGENATVKKVKFSLKNVKLDNVLVNNEDISKYVTLSETLGTETTINVLALGKKTLTCELEIKTYNDEFSKTVNITVTDSTPEEKEPDDTKPDDTKPDDTKPDDTKTTGCKSSSSVPLLVIISCVILFVKKMKV